MTIAGITDNTAENQGKRPLDVGTRHYSVRRVAPQEERDTVVDNFSQQDAKEVTASEAAPTSGSDNGASLIASTPDTGTPPAQAAAPKRSSAAAPLQSLAPSYRPEQHETYLNRLEEAVREPRNLNIALTGRYDAGKSSVPDQFQDNHHKVTLRLAISTLAPSEENTST